VGVSVTRRPSRPTRAAIADADPARRTYVIQLGLVSHHDSIGETLVFYGQTAYPPGHRWCGDTRPIDRPVWASRERWRRAGTGQSHPRTSQRSTLTEVTLGVVAAGDPAATDRTWGSIVPATVRLRSSPVASVSARTRGRFRPKIAKSARSQPAASADAQW